MIENRETSPDTFSFLMFHKGVKGIHWRKDSLFNKWYQENWISCLQKFETGPICFTMYQTRIKTCKDPNIETETLNLLKDKISKTLEAIEVQKDFLNRTTIVQEIRPRINT